MSSRRRLPFETYVTVTLEARDDETQLTLLDAGSPSDEQRVSKKAGA